jgi:hypothetical protein
LEIETAHIYEAIQMKTAVFFVGLVITLLGGLWLLQGLGLVNIRPILCFVDCAPIQGPSTTWAVIGAVVLTAGGALMFWSLKPRRD